MDIRSMTHLNDITSNRRKKLFTIIFILMIISQLAMITISGKNGAADFLPPQSVEKVTIKGGIFA